MKKNIITCLFVCLTFFVIYLITRPQSAIQPQSDDVIKVAATIFPIADIAQNVGGSNIEVITMVQPGASPHTFELTPGLMKELSDVGLVFAVGGDFDSWTKEVASAFNAVEIYNFSDTVSLLSSTEQPNDHDEHEEHDEDEHSHDHGSFDPHYWLSVENAKIIAEGISKKFIELDPENSDEYQNNLAEYKMVLDGARADVISILSDLPDKNLIVFHDSWDYFAEEFGLNIVGVFVSSPGKEPAPSLLKQLYETAQMYRIKAVFSEPQLSPDTIKPFVQDLNLRLYVLDPLGGLEERDSYINLLKYNAQTIQKAFE